MSCRLPSNPLRTRPTARLSSCPEPAPDISYLLYPRETAEFPCMRRTTATRKRAPDPHEGAGKRMSPRVPVQSDCTVHRDGSEFEGVLLDISTGGAAVEVLTRAPLDTGDEVTLELPTVLSVIKVAATVVSQDEEVFGT